MNEGLNGSEVKKGGREKKREKEGRQREEDRRRKGILRPKAAQDKEQEESTEDLFSTFFLSPSVDMP